MLNQQIILASRPDGWVTPENFSLIESELPSPGPGQVLIQNLWLSLDPYMRGRISEAKSYARGVNIGERMVGETVGQVIASNAPALKVGDTVLAAAGWQLFAAMDANAVTLIHTEAVSPSAYLGVLGMPGITAWTGLIDICQPRPGETVVVDAASGAVGSVVGQLAKLNGCRVIGIAGGPEKCRYVTQELGFDVCVDHRSTHFAKELAAEVPTGIDCLFENVGGAIFETLLTHMRVGSRIALCGMVSEFNREPHAYRTLRSILINRIRVQGFIVSDKRETWPGIRENLYALVTQGKLKFKESVTEGLANAPKAFVGLLKGENFGKQLIKLT